jgi:GNAT superfamily N-acetyltransferase
MSIEVRVARESDRERILAISSQIWDGYDYVPSVLDEWLAGEAGELLVAVFDGTVAAFSYRTWAAPRHAWLQGIRADTAMRGRGAGRALTEASLERSWRDGARRVGLSTYTDNQASMHIVETFGFRRVASFVYLEGDLPIGSKGEGSPAETLKEEEAIRFVAGSEYLAVANGRFPSGWKFLAFDWAPETALAWAPYRIGIRRSGKVVSALCASRRSAGADCATQRPVGLDVGLLSFLDGEPEDLPILLRQAASELGVTAWEAMVPKTGDRSAHALGALRDSGLRSWSEFQEDVFAYELDWDHAPRPGGGPCR